MALVKLPENSQERRLAIAYALYAVASLVSIAVMNIAAGYLGLQLLLFLGGFGPLLKNLKERLQHPRVRVLFYGSCALATACVLSLVVARMNPVVYGGKSVKFDWIPDVGKLWFLFWPYVLLVGLRLLGDGSKRFVVSVWLLAYGLLSCVGIIEHYTGWPRHQAIPGYESLFHSTIFLGHHLSVSSIWVFPLFIVLDFLRAKSPETRLSVPKPILALVGVLGFFALIFTYSRALWISLPAGLLIWVLWGLPKKWKLPAIGTLVVAGLLFSQLPVVKVHWNDGYGKGHRHRIWEVNQLFFKEHPIFGVGWRKNYELSGLYLLSVTPEGGYIFSGHAHNNFLDMLSGTGVIGALPWLFFNGMIFWMLFRALRSRAPPAFALGLLCAWVTFHINGLTQENFWEGKVIHQLMFSIAWILSWQFQDSEHEKTS